MPDDILTQLVQLPGISPQVLQMINQHQEQTANQEQEKALQENYARNKGYAKEGDYQTQLTPEQDQQFMAWIQQNKVPFNSKLSTQDYDMKGFWQALQAKDPKAVSAVDPNDNQIHYPDYWKTPYHETFSSESQWATDKAPKWNDKDQLVDSAGKVLFDDKAPKKGDK